MQLCDKDIHSAIVNGTIGFVGTNKKYPFLAETQVQPSSIDLRLGEIIVRFKKTVNEFDIKDAIDNDKYLEIERYYEGKPITIEPGETIFGQIYEQMWIGDSYSGRIEGRSRVARLGLSVNCTGGYINPGFSGAMPLQITNHNRFPIKIYPYIGICQLVIFQISGEPLVKYSDRSPIYNPYYNEETASPSVLRLDNDKENDNQSIVETRMLKLVKDYYAGLENQKNKSFSKKKQQKKDKEIQHIVNLNISTQGGNSMGDIYSATQVGTQGPNSGNSATISQSFNNNPDNIDFFKLFSELDRIKVCLKNEPENEENDILIGEVVKALKMIKENKKQDVIAHIKNIGTKLYDIAKSIGCSVVAKIIAAEAGI